MKSNGLARIMFGISVSMLLFGSGVLAEHYNVFPLPWLKTSVLALQDLLNGTDAALPWYYTRTDARSSVRVMIPDRMAPGLTLVAGAAGDRSSRVRVIDASGRVLREWKPDWFSIWPNPTHVPQNVLAKSAPEFVHGLMLMPNGDLVFNFMSALALVRMDPCGNVLWKRPWRTHHSIAVDNEGNLWIPGLHVRREKMPDLPNYEPPIRDNTLMRISPGGDLLQEISVFDILKKNGMAGLLYVSALYDRSTTVRGNTLHLNDIEPFPDSLAPGVFSPGDLMISLRNVGTVMVLDPRTLRVKHSLIGRMLRQHDPDFLDGNTISVFDNNNLLSDEEVAGQPSPEGAHRSSRILRFSATAPGVDTLYAGTADHPFFTDVMGQHERLSNGDLLLVESVPGRVLEVDREGQTVWEYVNLVSDGVAGAISDAQRLPPSFDERFFRMNAARCSAPTT